MSKPTKLDFGPNSKLTLQKSGAGKYTGKIIADRYQILQSDVTDAYFIVDYVNVDQFGFQRSVRKANGDFLEFETLEEAEAFCRGEVILPAKPKKESAPKDATPKVVKRTPAKAYHELILGGATDEAAYEAVNKEFGETSYRPTYPAWYRKQLIKKGLLPG